MILFGDYHTHTKYSRKNHGKGTVLENAAIAQNKGLKQIAITDHGFNHWMFGIKHKDIPQLKDDILNAKELTGVDILLGVESNIISSDGKIDVVEDDFEFLDILLMGFHNLVKMENAHELFYLNWANGLSVFSPSKERISRNTTAFLKAMDKYPIDVITHLNYGYPTDTLAVAKMAKEKGTLIELNGKRINFTDKELEIMASEGVKFIVNSDAHSPNRVGECNKAMNLIFRLNLPLNQIVNIDKLPKFENKRGRIWVSQKKLN